MFFLKKNLLFQTLRQKRSEKGNFLRLRSLNYIKRDQKNILRIFFLRFGDLFSHSRTFSRNKRLSKLLSMGPEDSLEKKNFQSTCFFLYILDLEPYFNVCGQNVSCDMSKLHFAFPKKRSFEEEQVLEKLIAFFSNSDLEPKCFWLLWKTLRQGCQICIRAVQSNFLRRTRLERGKKICLFQTLIEKLSEVGKIFLAALSKLHITNPEKKFRITSPEVRWPTLTNFDFLKKKFRRFFKIAFYRAKRIVIRNILFFNRNCSFPNFSGHGAKLFGNLTKKSSSVVKIPLVALRGTIWGEQCP